MEKYKTNTGLQLLLVSVISSYSDLFQRGARVALKRIWRATEAFVSQLRWVAEPKLDSKKRQVHATNKLQKEKVKRKKVRK